MQLKKILKTTIAFAISASVLTVASAADMTGAGSTFMYPIASKWAEAYKKISGNGLNYQSIGSGGGIKQIKAKTVDFGASDMPLKAEELQAEGLEQFPAIMGGVVPVVNLDGVAPGKLKLTGDVIAAIYLGKTCAGGDSTECGAGHQLTGSRPDLAAAGATQPDGASRRAVSQACEPRTRPAAIAIASGERARNTGPTGRQA